MASPATAQVATPPAAQSGSGAAAGVQFGGGISYLTAPEGVTRSMGSAFFGGVYARLPLVGSFSFQPEARWERRQSDFGSATITFDYLSIPLLVRLPAFFGLYTTQGVALTFPMRANISIDGEDTDIKDDAVSPGYGLIMGVGKDVGRASIEVRWASAFKAIAKDAFVDARSRSITAVVSIPLGGN